MEESEQKLITDREILDLSLKMEREGQAFYKSLSKHIQDSTVKKFVQQMYKEEIQHEKLFRVMLETKGKKSYGWENQQELYDFIAENLKTDIFPSLEDTIPEEVKFETLQKAVDFAIEAEMVAAEFYSLLGDYCDNLEAKTALLLLERTERDHVKEVLAIKVKLLQ